MYAQLGVDNTGLVTLKGLVNKVGGEYVNSGVTVTMTLYDSAWNEVSGQAWPTTLAYVAGSDGTYQGKIQKAANRVRGQRYTVEVVVTDGTDTGTFSKEIRSPRRGDS